MEGTIDTQLAAALQEYGLQNHSDPEQTFATKWMCIFFEDRKKLPNFINQTVQFNFRVYIWRLHDTVSSLVK